MHLLIDGNNLLYKSILGRGAGDEQTSDGRHTGAAVAFVRDVVSAIERHSPTHVVVAFDGPGPGFRRLLRGTYKASREHSMEDSARAQVPMIHASVPLLGLQAIESAPYEADDVLATLATRADAAGVDAVLLSDDKDLSQVLSRRVRQQRHVDARGGPAPLLGPRDVLRRWGLPPEKIACAQALCGDSGDEVAGISGVGPVSARRLVERRGSVEHVAAHADVDSGRRWAATAAEMVDVASHDSAVRLLTDVALPDVEPLPRDWPRRAAAWYASVEAASAMRSLCRRHRIQPSALPRTYRASRLFGGER